VKRGAPAASVAGGFALYGGRCPSTGRLHRRQRRLAAPARPPCLPIRPAEPPGDAGLVAVVGLAAAELSDAPRWGGPTAGVGERQGSGLAIRRAWGGSRAGVGSREEGGVAGRRPCQRATGHQGSPHTSDPVDTAGRRMAAKLASQSAGRGRQHQVRSGSAGVWRAPARGYGTGGLVAGPLARRWRTLRFRRRRSGAGCGLRPAGPDRQVGGLRRPAEDVDRVDPGGDQDV
jgi:hypothetical protein